MELLKRRFEFEEELLENLYARDRKLLGKDRAKPYITSLATDEARFQTPRLPHLVLETDLASYFDEILGFCAPPPLLLGQDHVTLRAASQVLRPRKVSSGRQCVWILPK